jgi:hypothetical protein
MQSVLLYDSPKFNHRRSHLSDTVLAVSWASLSELVSRATSQPTWLARIDGRLKELRSLPRGWDGYDASPISTAVLAFARSVLQSIMTPQCPPPSLVPTHGGGLQLEWHVAGGDVELMIYRPADASLSAFFADGRDPIEEEPLSSDFRRLSEVLNQVR